MDLVCIFFLTLELVTLVVTCYAYEVTLHRHAALVESDVIVESGHSSGMQRRVSYCLHKCRGSHALLPLTPSSLS